MRKKELCVATGRKEGALGRRWENEGLALGERRATSSPETGRQKVRCRFDTFLSSHSDVCGYPCPVDSVVGELGGILIC